MFPIESNLTKSPISLFQQGLQTLADGLGEDIAASNKVHLLESEPDGAWIKHYFPDRFSRPFAFYQKDFWNWTQTIEKDEKPRPRIECEPRGVGKSSSARGMVVYLLAKKIKSYILYICSTDKQGQKHYDAIRSMLESRELLKDYPHLSPQGQKHRPNVAKNWSSERLTTRENQVVEFISLMGNARGFTTEEGKRPDCFILDDIDDSKDSPHIIGKKIDILKTSVLPARAENTLILMPQNLIHRDSICQQIKDHRADILADRIFVGEYPLMKWYDAEKIDIPGDESGGKEWRITAGEPLDPVITIETCEQLLNEFGKDAFDRECQQLVFKVGDDKDFREWDEIYHIITYSEFVAFFEKYKVDVWNRYANRPQIPHNWNVGLGFDWGTTPEHPSAVVAVSRPNKIVPLSNSFFAFAETILPQFPLPPQEEVPLVSPGRVVKAIQETLRIWNVPDSSVVTKLMSHEASAALNTMAIDLKDNLKMFFNKWKAAKGSGVAQIQNLLEIDYSKPHPFRRHPKTDEPIMGCPRLFFIVPDKQGKLITDAVGKLYVAQPKDASGFARARYEIPIYSQYHTGRDALDNDFMDAFRGLANIFFVSAKPPTEFEKRELKLPRFMREETIREEIKTLPDGELNNRRMAREVKLNFEIPLKEKKADNGDDEWWGGSFLE